MKFTIRKAAESMSQLKQLLSLLFVTLMSRGSRVAGSTISWISSLFSRGLNKIKLNKRNTAIALVASVLMVPVGVGMFLDRLTVFRVYGESEQVEIRLAPKKDVVSPQFGFFKAIVCRGERIMFDGSGEGGCLGLKHKLLAQSGHATIHNSGVLSLERSGAQFVRVSYTPEAVFEQICSNPDWSFTSAVSREPSGFCGPFSITFDATEQPDLAWIVLRGSDITLGQDLRHTDHAGKAGFISGTVEVFGIGLLNEIPILHDWLWKDKSGYLEIRSYALQMGEVIRFEEDIETHITMRTTDSGSFQLTAWVVADYAVLSSFGAPDRTLGAGWYLRLSQDPLLAYWLMLIIGLVATLLRITL